MHVLFLPPGMHCHWHLCGQSLPSFKSLAKGPLTPEGFFVPASKIRHFHARSQTPSISLFSSCPFIASTTAWHYTMYLFVCFIAVSLPLLKSNSKMARILLCLLSYPCSLKWYLATFWAVAQWTFVEWMTERMDSLNASTNPSHKVINRPGSSGSKGGPEQWGVQWCIWVSMEQEL